MSLGGWACISVRGWNCSYSGNIPRLLTGYCSLQIVYIGGVVKKVKCSLYWIRSAGMSYGAGPGFQFAAGSTGPDTGTLGPDSAALVLPRPFYLVPADNSSRLPTSLGLYGAAPGFTFLPYAGGDISRPPLHLPGLSKLRDSSDVESSRDSTGHQLHVSECQRLGVMIARQLPHHSGRKGAALRLSIGLSVCLSISPPSSALHSACLLGQLGMVERRMTDTPTNNRMLAVKDAQLGIIADVHCVTWLQCSGACASSRPDVGLRGAAGASALSHRLTPPAPV